VVQDERAEEKTSRGETGRDKTGRKKGETKMREGKCVDERGWGRKKNGGETNP
jgi:hypothetical protein